MASLAFALFGCGGREVSATPDAEPAGRSPAVVEEEVSLPVHAEPVLPADEGDASLRQSNEAASVEGAASAEEGASYKEAASGSDAPAAAPSEQPSEMVTSSRTDPKASATVPPTTAAVSKATLEAQRRQLLLGRWKLDYHGTWINDYETGGTGRVRVDFDYAASWLYGDAIDFVLEWSLEGDTLTQTLASGKPKENYDALIKAYGNRRVYEVLELTKTRMRLRSKADNEISVWTRVDEDD